MQPAVVMRAGTKAVYNLVFLISLSIAYVHAIPLQVLPNLPGYIPVYIRHGDQPLEEINPALAEAFHEGSSLSKNVNLDSISDPPDVELDEDKANRYKVYPVRVREVGGRVVPKSEGDKKAIEEEESLETGASKSVASQSENDIREKHSGISVPATVHKVNVLTAEERESLEGLRVKSGEVKTPGNTYASISSEAKFSSETSDYRDKEEAFDPIVKVNGAISVDRLDSHLAEDTSKSTPMNSETSRLTLAEEVIKRQPLSGVLSNVKKLSPPPEILLNLEKERIDGLSLGGKSK